MPTKRKPYEPTLIGKLVGLSNRIWPSVSEFKSKRAYIRQCGRGAIWSDICLKQRAEILSIGVAFFAANWEGTDGIG